MSFFFILSPTLDRKFKKNLKIAILSFGVLFVSYFVYISNQRFTQDNLYAESIPSSSLIQDPVLYSYVDYLSQWYNNNMYVLDTFDSKTFNGQTSLQPVLTLLKYFNIGSFDSKEYLALRMKLWPLHWYKFNGFVAYSIYDYGYILAILFSGFYFYVVRRNMPKKNTISLVSLFVLVLLIQIPLMAIFYSTVSAIIFPVLFLIPIYFYLKVKPIN